MDYTIGSNLCEMFYYVSMYVCLYACLIQPLRLPKSNKHLFVCLFVSLETILGRKLLTYETTAVRLVNV